jgi:hypothetical protein
VFKIALVFVGFDREEVLPSFFVWFCAHGIFAVWVARMVIGLLKCVRENREVHPMKFGTGTVADHSGAA